MMDASLTRAGYLPPSPKLPTDLLSLRILKS
jgi:hypothetical protein